MSTHEGRARAGAYGIALGVPMLLLIALGLPVLFLPAGRDQAIFALMGSIIERGGMPYIDAFDFKPPGVYLPYALASALGDVMVGVHLLELFALAAAAIALHALVRPHGRFAASVAATHLVGAYLGTLRYWDLAQPEGFALPFALVGLVLSSSPRASLAARIAGGACLGAAALAKYPFVLFGLLVPLIARGHARSGTATSPLARAGAVAAGMLLPIAACAAWLALGGALGAFWSIQTGYLPGYTRLVTADGVAPAVSASWAITRDFFLSRPLLVWPPLLGLALAPKRAIVPLVGLALAALGTIGQGKFFHYHWIPVLPFLAWLTGLGAASLVALIRHRVRSPLLATSAVAVAIALAALALATSYRAVAADRGPAWRVLTGAIDRDALHRSPAFGIPGSGDHALSAVIDVARELRRRAGPGDRLLVWGFEPWIYLESGLEPASRFTYTAAFISPWCPSAWAQELARELAARPPAFVVVASGDAIPWVTGVPLDSKAALARYPAIAGVLRSRYVIDGQIERFTILTRADPDTTRARPAP